MKTAVSKISKKNFIGVKDDLKLSLNPMLEINKLFEETAKERGFYSKELITEIAKCGSVQDIPKLMLEEYVCADSEYTGECRICSV